MPTKKDTTAKPTDVSDAQELGDAESAQGFRGEKVDPTPNSEYSLLTGPDAPANTPGRNVQPTTTSTKD